jgi:predicted DNA-binding transcriptional regulator AlpA
MTDRTPPELITEPEAARALGVCPGTLKAARLHRLQSNPLRDLPHVRIGRSVRYRRSDIADWIEMHTVRPGKAQRNGAA